MTLPRTGDGTRLTQRAFRGLIACTALLALSGMGSWVLAARAGLLPVQPEFGGQCAEALAEGTHVMTDCIVTWTDKDGKTLLLQQCRGASKSFLQNPPRSCKRARDFIAAGNVEATEKAMQNYTGERCRGGGQGGDRRARLKANDGVFPLRGSARTAST